MEVYGVKRVAKELGVHPVTIAKLMAANKDFPAKKTEGINAYAFDVEACKEWLKHHHLAAYKEQLEAKEAMVMSDYAKAMGVARQTVQWWVSKGLPAKKLSNNKVLINIAEARLWFIIQKDPRTRSYAEKLRS